MLKKTIAYEDFEGTQRQEDFYFNLSKPELIELTLDGKFEAHMQRIIASQDVNQIVQEMKKIIHMAYGVKSDDGKRFIKSPQLTEEFTQTAAYDALFMELATNADAAAKFIEGIIPRDMVEAARQQDKPVGPPPLPPPPPVRNLTDL